MDSRSKRFLVVWNAVFKREHLFYYINLIHKKLFLATELIRQLIGSSYIKCLRCSVFVLSLPFSFQETIVTRTLAGLRGWREKILEKNEAVGWG